MATPRRTPARGLTFNAGNHRYRLDGEWTPGVTTILGCLDKPAIPKWAAATVAEFVAEQPDAVETMRALGNKAMVAALKEIPWQKRDDAGARGNVLHGIAQQLLDGDDVDVDDEHVPVVEHALEFLDDWHIEPLLVEAAVASRAHRWAGTADLFAAYVNPATGAPGVAVFDWKSGKAIYPEFAWQLNAYGHAEFAGLDGDEHPIPKCDGAFGVHIRADGYDVYPFRFGPDIYDEFVAIRNVYDITKRGRGDWRTPGSGHVGVAIRKDDAA